MIGLSLFTCDVLGSNVPKGIFHLSLPSFSPSLSWLGFLIYPTKAKCQIIISKMCQL